MDFYYEVEIKGSKETISFKADEDNKNETITGVKFKFDSDDESRDRDKDSRITMRIYGKFDDNLESIEKINKLSEWARDKKDIYREVTINAVTTGNDDNSGNFKRTYRFDRMFCIDYEENFSNDNRLTFELFIAQAPTGKVSETFGGYSD